MKGRQVREIDNLPRGLCRGVCLCVRGLVTARFQTGQNVLNNAFGSAVHFDCVPSELFITIFPLKTSEY
jgi:hypothetical protein